MRRLGGLRAAAAMAALTGITSLCGCSAPATKEGGPGSPGGGSYNFGSLASEFLQSKTERRILDQEDAVAPACQSHRFLKATIARQPTEADVGKGVIERKWVENWALERCGAPISYWVYFTEVGKGGAYIAVRGAEDAPSSTAPP